MKCFYNGTSFDIRGSIYVDKNHNKYKITGNGVRKSADGSKQSVYLKGKLIEKGEPQNDSQNNQE